MQKGLQHKLNNYSLSLLIMYHHKIVVITLNPARELEWTVDLFDELIGAGIYMYMFRWGKSPSLGLLCNRQDYFVTVGFQASGG